MYIDGWVIPQEVVGRAVRNLENTAKSPRYILEAIIIQKRDASVSLFTALVLGLIYPIYMLIALVGGLFRRQW